MEPMLERCAHPEQIAAEEAQEQEIDSHELVVTLYPLDISGDELKSYVQATDTTLDTICR